MTGVIEASAIWVKEINPIVEIHIRTQHEMIVIKENINEFVLKLHLRTSFNHDYFEILIGNQEQSKHKFVFEIGRFILCAEELQPLFNYLKINRI